MPKAEIADNDYDLSINRYKEVEYEAVEYDPPKVILERLAGLEEEVVSLHQKIDVLKEQLQAGMQTALECSAQVVRLAPPLLPRTRAVLCAQWSRH